MQRVIRGFTLIELLIVIAIILILIAIALPNFLDAQARAKVAKSEGDMRSMELAIESYFLDWKDYFRSWEIQKMTTPIAYMTTLPEDPFGPIQEDDNGYGAVLDRYGSPIKKFYIYHGPDVFDPNPNMQRIGVRWVLTGLGPDGGWFDSPNGADLYPRYSPTNGSRSRGNLEKVGPGFIPHEKFRLYWDNQ